jgi:hypothetical protein
MPGIWPAAVTQECLRASGSSQGAPLPRVTSQLTPLGGGHQEVLHVCCGSIRCTPVNSGDSGNLRSFRGFQESRGTPRGSASVREYPQVSAAPRGTPRDSGDSGNLRGTPGGSGGLRQTPRDDGDLRGFQNFPKVSDDLRDSPEWELPGDPP